MRNRRWIIGALLLGLVGGAAIGAVAFPARPTPPAGPPVPWLAFQVAPTDILRGLPANDWAIADPQRQAAPVVDDASFPAALREAPEYFSALPGPATAAKLYAITGMLAWEANAKYPAADTGTVRDTVVDRVEKNLRDELVRRGASLSTKNRGSVGFGDRQVVFVGYAFNDDAGRAWMTGHATATVMVDARSAVVTVLVCFWETHYRAIRTP